MLNSTAIGGSDFNPVFSGLSSKARIVNGRGASLLLASIVFGLPVAGCSGSGGGGSGAAVASSDAGAVNSVIGKVERPIESTASAAGGAGSTGTASSGSAAAGAGSSTPVSTAPATGGSTAGAKTGTSTPPPSTPPSAPPSTTPIATPPSPSPAVKKSISAWVSCTGTTDDAVAAATAFAAAKNNAFTLVVDCPVLIHSGLDIGRAIFIEDGTTVEFTGAGKFIVDDIFHPAFVIANSSNITLTDWNVEFEGSMPVNENVQGYMQNGQWVVKGGGGQPTNGFNDERLTPWLKANKKIVFDTSQGPVNSYWAGTTNTCAMFFMVGDSSNINVTGMHVYAPPTAGGNSFIPVVFSFDLGYKSNQTVTVKTPITAQYIAVPHNVNFTNTVLDGTYMGWVGSVQDLIIDHTQSNRYGDLQDANGANVGGIGKWFAPPHLFYFNYSLTGDPALYNSNIQIKNVVDSGQRVGTARDRGGSDSLSGNALSLKIGCVDCSVDTYSSARPDGFLDVLNSNGLTISNVTATYNSAFLNNVYPGWRFPQSSYQHVTFENISLTDTAPVTVQRPMGNASETTNSNNTFSNVKVAMVKWAGSGSVLPVLGGTQNNINLEYTMTGDDTRVTTATQGTVSETLQVTPATLSLGKTAALTWSSKEASTCSASGAWAGALVLNGSQTITPASAGNYNFTLYCQNGSASSSTTLPASVTVN